MSQQMPDTLPTDAGGQKMMGLYDPTSGLFAAQRAGLISVDGSLRYVAGLATAVATTLTCTHSAVSVTTAASLVGILTAGIDAQGTARGFLFLDTTATAGANTVEAKLIGRLTAAGDDYELGTIVFAHPSGARQVYPLPALLAPFVLVQLRSSAGTVICTANLYLLGG
jgi:hypothetical protein